MIKTEKQSSDVESIGHMHQEVYETVTRVLAETGMAQGDGFLGLTCVLAEWVSQAPPDVAPLLGGQVQRMTDEAVKRAGGNNEV